jgi:hypothetical protein
MSNSVNSIQATQAQAQTGQTVQPPKKPQAVTQGAIQQDTVTISKATQQALASNTKPATSGDVDHDGDSH